MKSTAKRLLSLVIVLAMALSMLPMTAFAFTIEGSEGFPPEYYVTGTMNGWAVLDDDYGMEKQSDGTYVLTFAITAGEHKLNVMDTWSDILGDGEAFTVVTDGDVTVTFNSVNGTVSVTGDCLAGQKPSEPAAIYIVAGSDELCGSEWDPADLNNQMFDEDGDGIYTIIYKYVAAGDYEFRVTNGTWDESWGKPGGDNYVLDVAEDDSTVTINFNSTSRRISVVINGDVVTEPPTEPASVIYIVAGSDELCGSAWDPADLNNQMFDEDGDGIYTIIYKNVAAGDYEFKVTNGTWDEYWPENNCCFTVVTSGDVTVTFNPADASVNVTGDCLDDESGDSTDDTTGNNGTTTVYCQVPDSWTTCNAYWWGSSGFNPRWPGEDMTKNEEGIWSFDVPSDATGLIFSNGNGIQTNELTVPTGDKIMYVFDYNYWATYSGVKVPVDYYVVGTMNGWKENDAAYKMVARDDGTCALTIMVTAGEYELAVTDGTLNNAWPSDNYRFTAVTDGEVTVIFNLADASVTVIGDCLDDKSDDITGNKGTTIVYCQAPYGWETYKVYWWGSSGFNPSWPGVNMIKNAKGIWYYAVPSDAEGLIFHNDSGTMTADLTIPTDENVMYVFSHNSWTTYSGVQVPVDYYVAGYATLCGVSWSPNAAANKMSGPDGNGIYTLTYTGVAAGNYEFKVTDGTWNNSWPGVNYRFTAASDGDVTITFNPVDGTVSATGDCLGDTEPAEPDEPDEPGEVIYTVAGISELCGSEWDPTDLNNQMFDEDGDGVFTITYENVAAGDYEFKVTNGTWNLSWGDNGSNYCFTVISDCDVTVTFDSATHTVNVTYAANPSIPEGFYTNIDVIASDTTFNVGDTIDYTVIANAADISAMEFVLVIPEGLSYVANSAKVPAGLSKVLEWAHTGWTESLMKWTGYNDLGTTFPTDTVILTFSVIADVAGTYEIILQEPLSYDPDFQPSDANVNVDAVTVSDGFDHVHTLNLVPGTASCTQAGYIAYYACTCNKLFADAAGTIEITEADVTVDALGHIDEDANKRCDRCGTSMTDVPGFTTVYCQTPDGWTACNVYWWGGDGNNIEWPGAAMRLDKEGVWCCDVPSNATGLIFNNGSGTQSRDLTIPTDENVMFAFSKNCWTVYGKTDITTDYYVSGRFNGWSPNNADYQMIENGDGTYSLTFAVTAGEYELVVTDGTWSNMWGDETSDSGNYCFTATNDGNVTVTFDPATHTINVAVDPYMNIHVVASATTVNVGDTIDYTIIANAAEISAMTFKVTIPEGLSYVAGSAKVPAGLVDFLKWEAVSWAEIDMMWTGYNSLDATFLTDTVILTFSVTADVAGTYEIALDELLLFDTTYEELTADLSVDAVTVLSDLPAESDKVTGLTCSAVTENSFTVTWDVLEGAKKYWVYVDGAVYNYTTSNQLTVSKRNPGTEYTVLVTASMEDDTVLPVRDAQRITVQTASVPMAPTKVTGLTCSAVTENSFTVTWDVLEGAKKYWVYVDGAVYNYTTSNQLTVSKRNPGTEYTVLVTASLEDGTVLPVLDAQWITVQTASVPMAPAKVTGLTCSAVTENSFTVTWDVLEGAKKYWVYVDGAVYNYTTSNQLTVSKRNPGTEYTVLVTASMEDGTVLSVEAADGIIVRLSTTNTPTPAMLTA